MPKQNRYRYKKGIGLEGLVQRVVEGRQRLLSFDDPQKQNAYTKWLNGEGPRPDFITDGMIENVAPGLNKGERSKG